MMSESGTGSSVWAIKIHPKSEPADDESNEDGNRSTKGETHFKAKFKEFGGNATLHGLRYVADSDMHILRR